jgi:hypothetical protein
LPCSPSPHPDALLPLMSAPRFDSLCATTLVHVIASISMTRSLDMFTCIGSQVDLHCFLDTYLRALFP